MEFKDIKHIEKAQKFNHEDGIKIFIVLIFFLVISLIAVFVHTGYNTLLLVFATIVGGYMAMNIGANDVANNVGPAVGSQAITLIGAIIIAAICVAMGLCLRYWCSCLYHTFPCRWYLRCRNCRWWRRSSPLVGAFTHCFKLDYLTRAWWRDCSRLSHYHQKKHYIQRR